MQHVVRTCYEYTNNLKTTARKENCQDNKLAYTYILNPLIYSIL